MPTVDHKAILASAGSGKTFQLAQRYIRLLALAVDPERIVALTFSRKAAGEIFESIVQGLSRAALDPGEAAAAARRIDAPELGPSDFLRLLRQVLSRLHALRISTLDSFSVGILRAFPFELGLTTDLELMDNDGPAAQAARREVLRCIYDPAVTDAAAQQRFFEAFKQSTFGQESKDLASLLDPFLSRHYATFQLAPAEGTWGRAPAIWPRRTAWLRTAMPAAEAAAALTVCVDRSDWSPTVKGRWFAFVNAAQAYDVGSPWVRELDYLWPRLATQVHALRAGQAEIKVGSTTCRLGSEACGAALSLLTHIMAVELTAALARTQGLWRLLSMFDRVYHEQVRRQGRLTFHDANVLLLQGMPSQAGPGGPAPAERSSRLMIDARLDARLDHWLLDEFQDTSDAQWGVLQNLIDEVVQDPGGGRSVFIVGDVKQAIYGWRGGNPHLFRRILQHYEGAIPEEPLATSFRSAEPIIECVNQVFGDLPEQGLSDRAVATWRSFWVPHRVQRGVVPAAGYAALLEPPCGEDGDKPGSAERIAVAAAVLKEIRPLDRGLSVGVLVRTNQQGVETADALRRLCPGMPIAHEGAAGILDNPVGNLLCALVQAAFHPGDRLAWRHLAMSPLAGPVAAIGRDPSERAQVLLDQIFEGGFQSFIQRWGAALDAATPLDAFGRRRWRDLWHAAGMYDATGGCDGSDFLRWAREHHVRDPAADAAVRVMTIHQSKGLGFDVVLLPELQGPKGIGHSGPIDFVAADPGSDRGIQWVLAMPRRAVAELDPVLAEQCEAVDHDRCFEALCVLYVAMTRARRALYLITSFAGPTAAAMTEAALLKRQFTGNPRQREGRRIEPNGQPAEVLWDVGVPEWWRELRSLPSPAPAPSPRKLRGLACPRSGRLRSVAPSAVDAMTENAGALFQPRRYQTLDVGAAVHALFERVEWWDPAVDAHALAASWRLQCPFDAVVADAAVGAFVQALDAEDIRQALRHPGGPATLWREKRFEIVHRGEWITGAFDRVVIRTHPDGRPCDAVIQDFKTNDLQTDDELRRAADHYGPQLRLYRTALARILDLPEAAISCELLFVRPGRILRI